MFLTGAFSSDTGFIEDVRSALSAGEFKILPMARVQEAVGYDLVVIGWDTLKEFSRDSKLVLRLLNSSRVLVVAEPGEGALRILFSSVVEPVMLA